MNVLSGNELQDSLARCVPDPSEEPVECRLQSRSQQFIREATTTVTRCSGNTKLIAKRVDETGKRQ